MARKVYPERELCMTLNKTRALLLLVIVAGGLGASKQVVSAPPLPNPVLYFVFSEPFEQRGKTYIRYRYDVFNKDAYPADMFAASPNLPPCGANTKASRTWVLCSMASAFS